MGLDSALDDLVDAVGREHVLVDDDQLTGYEVDWTGRYRGNASAVVRPHDSAEVASVLRVCATHGLAVVAQAGNTGLVGGSVPRQHLDRSTVIISLNRLDELGPVDASAMQVTAGAGVTLAAWRRHAHASGLDTPIDFAARDTATIGGAIATNAGGSRVLRFGTMRQQIVGIEAVTASGAIVGSLSGLPKETAGLHWPSLLAGSEGTLAIVTAARLRLVPRFRETTTALVATHSIEAATGLLASLRRNLTSLDAVEVLAPPALDLVCDHLRRQPPVVAPTNGMYVVIDCADHSDPTGELADVLSSADGVAGAAMTSDASQRIGLIEFRDRMTEAIAAKSTAIGTPTFKLDVAVPVGALGELLEIAQRAAADDGCLLIAFGHLAEGNLHLNHLGASDSRRIADTVLRHVAALGGTISAEHGIGVAKTPWLDLIRTPDELAAQSAIRAALDPQHILNPGVLELLRGRGPL